MILPAREFGQREHLFAIAVLPYLALCARRIDRECELSPTKTVISGIVAGLGIALKPYFVVVPLLVEGAVQLFSSKRPKIWRAESLAIVTVGIAYAVWLGVFERVYLFNAVPLAREIYWSFDRPLPAVLQPLIRAAILAFPFAIIAFRHRDSFGLVLGAAWIGFSVSYFAQQKGYPYHILPVQIATLLLAAAALTSEKVERGVRYAGTLLALMILGVYAGPVSSWWALNRPGGDRSRQIVQILASIDQHARGGRFLVVAVHPYPAFPPAIYSGARYVSRTNSQWFLPAVVLSRRGKGACHEASAIERHARQFVAYDLAQRPDLVLIDTNSARHTVGTGNFDFLGFYEEDPAYRAAWRAYREIEPLGQFRQFVRVEAMPPQPSRREKVSK
jgi:hypothetical protein